jgi:hypothetical protein
MSGMSFKDECRPFPKAILPITVIESRVWL